jgi:catechol 2,3-dioxygenase-like lactoylglutathione lyase family enzyme
MKRSIFAFAILVCCVASFAADSPKRPRILGIAEADIYVTNIAASRNFYSSAVGPTGPCVWCEEIPRSPFIVPLNDSQNVFLWNGPSTAPSNLLTQITFWTDDLKRLKEFLTANKTPFNSVSMPGNNLIKLTDPEGNHLAFRQFRSPSSASALDSSGLRLIHAGFVVRDRASEDHFFKDILGFRSYWHGGMKDDKDDWVAMQVPDGTDWVEYMLNISPNADKHTLGVMNHIALGVTDIHATQQQLIKNGWKSGEEPKLGRDGKWQLNLYDPDDTRVEFMEFTPKEKPCCSEFTGPHPGPKK